MRQEEENLEAAQALVSNIQERRTFGFGVISGGNVTINTGTLGGSDTLSVEATDVLVNGTEHNLSSDTVGIDSSANFPRRDVVYVDSNGDLQVAEGDAEEAQTPVTNPDYVDYYKPVPVDLEGVDATALCEVWVPADLSAISSNELIDRRTDATITANALDTNSATVSDSPTAENDVAIKSYVDSVAQGLDWQDSVINELNDPPGSPSEGDRYLIDTSPTGAWVGHAEEITEYIDGAWEFFTPNEGWAVFIEDVDLLEVYNSTAWVAFGSAIDHGALAGLGDDDHTQYLLVDGTRAMSGALDMGSNDIDNAGSITATSAIVNELDSSIETPSSVSGSRSVDTEYQNTNSHNLFVSAIFRSDGTQEIAVNFDIGNTSGALVTVDQIQVHAEDLTEPFVGTVGPVEVPVNGYYEIETGANHTGTVVDWVEWGRV